MFESWVKVKRISLNTSVRNQGGKSGSDIPELTVRANDPDLNIVGRDLPFVSASR
jgi:hypothetical protein